jgi:hypothetical protein
MKYYHNLHVSTSLKIQDKVEGNLFFKELVQKIITTVYFFS